MAVNITDLNFDGVLIKQGRQPQSVCYYVMSYVEYGEMYNLVDLGEAISEGTAKFLFRKIFSGRKVQN